MSPPFREVSNSFRCVAWVAESMLSNFNNSLPSSWTAGGYLPSNVCRRSGRTLASAFDSLRACTSFEPTTGLDECSKAPRSFVNSSGPAVFIVSIKDDRPESVHLALDRTVAAELRTITGWFGLTLAQRKLSNSESTEDNPLGRAAKASRRNSGAHP